MEKIVSFSQEEISTLISLSHVFCNKKPVNTFETCLGDKCSTFDSVTLTDKQLAVLKRLSDYSTYKFTKLFQ